MVYRIFNMRTFSSSVVSLRVEIQSEDPGFDPLAGQGEKLSVHPSQLLCRLVCSLNPSSCAGTARTHICAHVKDPISICREKSRPHSRWYGNTKTLHAG